MLIFLISFFFIIQASSADESICYQGKLEVLNEDFFTKISMPNCTTERPNKLCKCASNLEPFFNDTDLKQFKKDRESFKSDLAEKLIEKSKVKIVKVLHDLNYANTFLHVNSKMREQLTKQCDLKSLSLKLSHCKQNSNLNSGKYKNGLEPFIKEIQNEGQYLLSNTQRVVDDGFFKRSIHESKSCFISDVQIQNIMSFYNLYHLIGNFNKDKNAYDITYKDTPIGHYLTQETPIFENITDIQNYINQNDIQQNYVDNFISSCKQSFDDVEKVLCADASTNALSSEREAIKEFEINKQKYKDNDFKYEKYLKDQLTIYNFCKNKKKSSDDFYSTNRDLLEKDLYGTFSPELSSKENFREMGYINNFQNAREKLCSLPSRPLTKTQLIKPPYNCSLNDFSKNLNREAKTNVGDRNCPILVLDYILNTPTEELETQNIDKNLIAYKKTIEENKKSNGGDLILDFLGVQSPKDVEIFKKAGIERKDPNNSDDNTTNKNSSSNSSVVVQKNDGSNNVINSYTQTNTTGQKTQETYSGSSGQNYQNSPTYQAMTPQEKSQVSEVERELMRRLMGSKVNESSSAARAEMYEKYSKEMMELAKEKNRLETASEKTSAQDLSDYEKKMQSIVDQMREENKKLANSQKSSSGESSHDSFSNENVTSSNGIPNKGSNFMATTASSGEREVINPNSKFNRALNETVNAEKFYELTGKKTEQNTQTDRSPASNSSTLGFTLIENDKIVDISNLEEIFSKKLREKKPFVIAQKNNPDFKVKIIPNQDDKITITPLGDLSDPNYKMFYEEIEQSYQQIQEYHLSELTNKLLEAR